MQETSTHYTYQVNWKLTLKLLSLLSGQANNLKEMRAAVADENEITEWRDSIATPRQIIWNQMEWLELMGKPFLQLMMRP